jgi:hypothetical protein
METGITEKLAGTLMHSPKPSPSSIKEISKLLTKFAERRQAQVNPSTLLTFADDLSSYQLSDIDQALMRIASVPRRDGETAFPEVATILEAVRGVIRARKAIENDEGVRWAKYVERCKAEGTVEPDAETLEKIEALNEKFSLTKPKEIVTVNAEIICPRCQFAQAVSANFRNWTADEILDYGAVVKELEQIAERNRSMPDLLLGDVVEEVSE